MNDRTMQIMIAETAARAISKMKGGVLRPGTVTNTVGPFVLIDGDDAAVEVPSIIGPVPVGQRVMVMFHPPSGVVVIGCVGGYRPPAATLSGSGSLASGGAGLLVAPLTVESDPFNWADGSGAVIPTLDGWYQWSGTTDWQAVADYLRVLVGPVVNSSFMTGSGRLDLGAAIAATFTPRSIVSTGPWMRLVAGDVVSLQLFQQNNAAAARTWISRFTLEWKAPL